MRAIILAAGRGSRMKKLTEQTPKCLLQFQAKALLDWQIEAIRGAGIEEIAIVTGYKRELLANRGLVEFHNERWFETNMVESLTKAESWLQEAPCIVSYSDIVYEASAITSLMNSDSSIAITYDPNWRGLWERRFDDPLEDAETFRLAADNKVMEIGKQPQSLSEIEGQYMGLLRFTPQGWAEVRRIRSALSDLESDGVHMTSLLQGVIEQNILQVEAIGYQGMWAEFDSETDFDGIDQYEVKNA